MTLIINNREVEQVLTIEGTPWPRWVSAVRNVQLDVGRKIGVESCF
jgi:hypothetical protein